LDDCVQCQQRDDLDNCARRIAWLAATRAEFHGIRRGSSSREALGLGCIAASAAALARGEYRMIRAELAVAAIALVAAVAVAGAQAQMQGASETGAFLKPSCRKVSNGASVGVATFGGLFHFNESN
jgi:hypothetical protein